MTTTGEIGNTPLIEIVEIAKKERLTARIFAKAEYCNIGGSIKDRVAKAIIDDAERNGKLKAGGTVIEATSGNTGIGLAIVAAARGYKAVIVMPETMSVERQELLKKYGAEVVLTSGSKGMQGAVERAEALLKENANAIIAGQFDNPANPQAHYQTTAPEIYEALCGKVDLFVSCVGTGGTLTGVGKFLKEKNPQTRVVAVEPAASPLLSQGVAGAHKIQGIGANFVPTVLDRSVYDEIICVTDEEAFAMAKRLYQEEKIFAGISAGAAVAAAIALAKGKEYAGKNIVTVLPDGGDRYLSTGLYD